MAAHSTTTVHSKNGLKSWKLAVFLIVLIVVLVGATGGFPVISLFGRVIFLLFLPGLAIIQAVTFGQFSILEKIVLSPVLGMAYVTLVTLYFSAASVPINGLTLFLAVVLLTLPLLAYSQRKGKLRIPPQRIHIFQPTYLILAAILAISIILISIPFPVNGIFLPSGDDPATSSLAATLIAEQGKIPQSWAPYFPEQSPFNYSPGYPSIVASLYLLDPSLAIPFLVSLFSVFFAIIPAQIYIIARRITKDNRMALLATAFSAVISVGFSQMMVYGRFPALVGAALTLGLLLFAYLFACSGSLRLLILSGLTMASLFLSYTVSYITAALFVVLFFGLQLVFSRKFRRSVLGVVSIFSLGIGLASPWMLSILGRLSVVVPPKEVDALVLWFTGNSLRAEIGSQLLYYGYWFILFGVMWLLVVFVRTNRGSFLLAWFLSILLLMANEILHIRFPDWYYLQTGAFLNPLLTFPLSLLAAIGIVKLYDILKLRSHHFQQKPIKKYLPLIVVAIILLPTFYLGAPSALTSGWFQHDRISNADYDALNWISNNTAPDSVIYNDHWVGSPSVWIPAISHRRIIMPLLSISEVGWSDLMFTRQDESLVVANAPDSTEALAILRKYDVSYIYLGSNVSRQVQYWRNNYDPNLFLASPHYKVVFNEENAWILKVNY